MIITCWSVFFQIMAANVNQGGTSKRGHVYRTSEAVLAALFSLPSDSESNDDLEESDTEHDDRNSDAGTGNVLSNVVDDDDDDDDILYTLASDVSEVESDVDEHDTSDADSDAEESDWTKTVIKPIDFDAIQIVPKNAFLPSDGPHEFFSKFFDIELMELLVQQTNLYAKQNKLRNWCDVTMAEMNAFLAILIAIGLHQIPQVEMFWSTDPLFRVQPVADSMPIKRFKKILQGFHVSDNSKALKHGDPQYDRLHKVRPLLQKLNKEFQGQSVSSTSQSIDEAMILFKGRSTIKQYMPLKPVKRGYKVWARCDSTTGYVYQFDIYTGKAEDQQAGVGLGSLVVLSLGEAIRDTNSHLTFDNFFASHSLLEDLYSRNIYATATVRTNRKGLPVLATQKTSLQKGEFKWRSKQHTTYLQWMDTKPVHIMTTAFGSSEGCDVCLHCYSKWCFCVSAIIFSVTVTVNFCNLISMVFCCCYRCKENKKMDPQLQYHAQQPSLSTRSEWGVLIG